MTEDISRKVTSRQQLYAAGLCLNLKNSGRELNMNLLLGGFAKLRKASSDGQLRHFAALLSVRVE